MAEIRVLKTQIMESLDESAKISKSTFWLTVAAFILALIIASLGVAAWRRPAN